MDYQSLTYEERLSSFHDRCIRTILGVTKYKQLACEFGMEEPLEDLVMEYHLRWLEHLGIKREERLPKMSSFEELEKKRPCHGTKERWRDRITSDLSHRNWG